MKECNTKRAIMIRSDLYEEIAEYCKLNGLKIQEFCNEALQKLISNEKFGDVPFGTIKDGELPIIKSTEQEQTPITQETEQETKKTTENEVKHTQRKVRRL